MGAKILQPGQSGLVDPSLVLPNPNNPRKFFADDKIAGLSSTLKSVGQIHDAVVMLLPSALRRGSALYMILDGERRWRSAKRAKKQLEVKVVEWIEDRIQQLLLSGVANTHGEELSDIEQGRLFSALYDGGKGMSLEQIGQAFGGIKDFSVSTRIQVVEQCPKEVLAMMDPALPKKARLSMDRAYSILVGLRGHPEEMIKQAKEVVKKGINQADLKRALKVKSAQLGVSRERGRYRPVDTRKALSTFLDRTQSTAKLMLGTKKGLLIDALETGKAGEATRMAKQARAIAAQLEKLAENLEDAVEKMS